MEVSVTTGALNPLLGKLTTLLGEEYKQLKVMRKEAAFLKHELSAMKALLDKMELMDELDPLAKNWRDHIREMSYDMENCIDDIIHDIEGADAKKGFVKKMARRLKKLRSRHQIANRMEELKVLAVEANAWCERYKINECINSSHDTVVVDLGMKAIYKEAAGLVGIDGPREDLVSLLMDSEKELKVVSIVGFGGLGKTALAKQVYDEVGEQFTLKAFFSVSQSPDVKSLLSGLQLKLGIGDSSHAYELENIVDRLREHLKHKRYLIIVDDLWDQSTWNTIRCAFPDNANGSRVVVTTRLHDVAATTCLSDRACIYNMKPLKEQDSRRLFFNRVFGPENACPPQFKEISAQILKKCGGLPLAIITIASLLASHEARPLSEWESIKNSLGAKSATKPTLEEMRAILNLSYMNLPVYLRPCFLYLGMYPEDREIERDDLVRQWIAEGFVPSLHGANLDDVAESYFNELVNRSMIQPERTACGEVLSCRVHDMMLDLILSKSTEDNFISVAYNYEDMATLHSCKYKVRRLSLQSSLGGATPENLATSMSQVRSYARFGGSQYTPPLSQLKYLRVLAFEFPDNWEMTVDLTAIGHLLLLRYLMVVARSAGVAFPTKIQGLVHLETLELYCEPTQSFPSDISCLENLFHLQLPIGRALPKGMKKMKSIRSLRCSDLSESSLEDIKGLSELTNLKGLDLSTDDNKCLTLEQEDAFVSSIGMLRDLKYLHLDCQRGCSDLDSQLESLPDPPTRLEVLRLAGWKFSRVPKWIGELRCLRILRLRVLHLSSDEFRALGELPSLVDSGVYVADVSRDKVVVSTGLFPVLENFEFQSNKDVNAYLSFEVGAMPRLQKLTLQFSCKKWRGATPVGMECLPCLQEISVCALLYTSAESSKNYEEVRAAVESAFKSAARAHPRHPSIRFTFGHSRVWKSFVSMPVQERVISDVLDYGSSTPTLFDGSVRASLGAMRPLVGKLDMLLQAPPKGCSSQSVKDKMQLLKEDVEEISSCLDELSEVEEPPLTAKCWMNQAHDLCYNIEDYIDSLLFVKPADPSLLSKNINSTRPRLKLSFHAKILKRLKRPEQIAVTVSKFSMLIQKAIERHQRYDLHSCSTLRQRFVSLGPMLPTPYEETADDIVIDGRMNDFINSLANDRDKQTKVISVLGSSCLGKTILSRVLYNRIGGQFDCRAFVRVSKQPDMKSIFRGMLSELQRQHPPQDCKEIDLIDNIKIYLQDKRYLVIVDDVWTASVWDIINHAFPRGSHGSRIITTTQIDDVALTCCCYQSKHVFQMKPLDDDHSRKLFFGTLFGSESSSPAKFKEDLNKIVEICGGLPLATISIASLLVSQPVMTTELLDYIRKSLSSRFLEKSTLVKTRQALNLSFNNLPRYLKSCLLYLSMYPEGYEFLKHDLVKQWVTEGLIDTTEGQDIENVAESYLDQLIGRRFIQPICISYNNEVVSCAVHDAIHDFIVHKSAEENFIVAIDHSRKNVSLSHIVRRLSLLFGDARYAKTPTSMSRSQIRSLRFSGLFECMPRIREFKLLRVLNLHLSGHTSNNDPPIDLTEISELFLLRYLKIASDVCIKLPNRMRGLQCLETLDVMAATRITAIPWDIIHLPHLFNLTLPVGRNLLDLIGSMGDSIISLWSTGKLNNLHNLHLTSSASTLASSDHLQRSMEALGTLLGGHGNLKTLALTHDDGSWHKDASRVIICWDGLAPPPLLRRFEFSPHSCITFSRIPQWLNELGNLCFLKITVRNLQINCVDILRGLPALATLSLYVDTAAFDKIIFGNTGFSVLKYFKFRCSAPWLKFEAGAMPNLGKLMLGFNAIPRMDQHRHANTVITIEHMPELKKISAKIGGATANTDAESALRTIVSNHQSNPTINVQLVDYIFYGEVRTKQKQQQPDEIEGLLLGETS